MRRNTMRSWKRKNQPRRILRRINQLKAQLLISLSHNTNKSTLRRSLMNTVKISNKKWQKLSH
jgi:intracellular septation protein A